VTTGLKPGGIIVLNTPMAFQSYHFKDYKLATADVTAISVEAGLPHGMVNSGIIGALAKATNLLSMESLIKGIQEEFRTREPQRNVMAAQLTFERTVTGG
jgi:Pyruvate/2-oxoacid:ferredoxin oxidoreductase gamma subunit